MRHFIKYSVAALAAFSLTFTTVPASAADREKPKSRKELARENARMREVLDSLISELENVRSKAVHHIPEQADEGGLAIEGLLPEDYTLDVTDSLLSLWYVHKSMLKGDTVSFNMDSVHFRSSVTDKEYLQRLADMNSFITLPFNETVRNYIILYSEKMPTKMSSMLALSQYYFPIFEEIFDRYGLPKELKYMAVIESAFNPVAVSRAGAKGMWQFMYNTAKMYGLTINSFVDERLDPVKSADAAARYMRDAYRIFGDWNLAISSYNCGSGNVNKAMRRSGSREFWPVYNYLPRETRGYVPAFVGAMYAFTYYKEHGIVPEKVQMPAHLDTFQIHRMLHFQQVRDLTGISLEELRNLNPQYIHDIIPGNEKEYILRLPLKYSGKFIECEDSVYTHRASELFNPSTLRNIANSGVGGNRITYRVKSGDYLGRIASKYHVSVAQLKKWNHLRSNNLKIGQVLVIYKGGGPAVSSSASSSAKTTNAGSAAGKTAGAASKTSTAASPAGSSSSAAKTADVPDKSSTGSSNGEVNAALDNNLFPGSKRSSGGVEIYVVKKGDTLYSIAKAYPGISANDIMKANGIGTSIKPGMKLKIPKK